MFVKIAPAVLALAYLAAHLPFLAPSLEDIDSINFALAIHEFDPTNNQPHPPGYPVYVGLARAMLAAVGAARGAVDPMRTDALALALLSSMAGAAAIAAAAWMFKAFSLRAPGAAVWAAALLAASPLFWLTGLRPMSDMPGIAASLVAQSFLVWAVRVKSPVDGPPGQGSWLIAGAFASGLAAGVRSQAAWLALPLLGIALHTYRRRGSWWLLTRPGGALAVGAALWAIPLIAAAGGIDPYLQALQAQAGDDFTSVDMLSGDLTARHLARALTETFVLPWSAPLLAAGVLAGAALGAGVLLVRDRSALALLGIAFVPYAAFHLLFQETLTVRYALPLLTPVAGLAAVGAAAAGRTGAVLAGVGVAASLAVSLPAAVEYAREAHPAFRAVSDMVRAAADRKPGAVLAHHALGRPLAVAQARSLNAVEPVDTYEWLDAVTYWREGGAGVVWFLADPRRTDLALIDPQSRLDVTPYRWRVAARPELGGTRPLGADWYRMPPPGWFVGEGWSLSLEAGGVTFASGHGLTRGPIEGYVRRRTAPAWMIVGGRDLGAPSSRPSAFELSLDGIVVDRWTLDPAASPTFLRTIEFPDGISPGSTPYARLLISARAVEDGAPTPPVAIREFDVQSGGRLVHGYGEGWHAEESDAATGQRWRWTSDRSILHIRPARDLELVLRGESPLTYLDRPPTVRVLAGTRELAVKRPSSAFEWRIRVSADDLISSGGTLSIETDRVYLPGQAEGTSDPRRLGLRLYDLRLHPVEP